MHIFLITNLWTVEHFSPYVYTGLYPENLMQMMTGQRFVYTMCENKIRFGKNL